MEEHKESHVVECVYCKEKFESIDKVIDHENEGECDLCGKKLGCGTKLVEHKKREHESRELKIESHRGTQASCAETLYMGTPSKSRQRFQDQRTRTDSKGRDFYQDRKSRNDSRGRSYY